MNKRVLLRQLLTMLDAYRRARDAEPPDRFAARAVIDESLAFYGVSPGIARIVRVRLFRQARTLADRKQIPLTQAVHTILDRYLQAFPQLTHAMHTLAAIEQMRLSHKRDRTRVGNTLYESADACVALLRLLYAHIRAYGPHRVYGEEEASLARRVAVVEWMADQLGSASLYVRDGTDPLDDVILSHAFILWERFDYREQDLSLCWQTSCMLDREGIPFLLARNFAALYGPRGIPALHQLLEERLMDRDTLSGILLHSSVFHAMSSREMVYAVRHWVEGARPINGLVASARTIANTSRLDAEVH